MNELRCDVGRLMMQMMSANCIVTVVDTMAGRADWEFSNMDRPSGHPETWMNALWRGILEGAHSILDTWVDDELLVNFLPVSFTNRLAVCNFLDVYIRCNNARSCNHLHSGMRQEVTSRPQGVINHINGLFLSCWLSTLTGPASGPRPASSTPATCACPLFHRRSSKPFESDGATFLDFLVGGWTCRHQIYNQ